ncbi:recombinase family protein [Pseudomonas sp. MAP12]|uniref:Recombinase family protein n=1 Tax=Geopseudomonas aromaticivorans TaxID=2849492 RepID=A0ABS6MUB5_9GAMM|nr:recombinase family protein [Pseudomonas aromaticivorans]MBV2131852.1 recombinase family protein [Pseudomonas aromaticivorans]
MPQAISYTRFSSILQSKGSSKERQKELISNWLDNHPEYSLSPLSADDHGRSGYSGEHLKHGLGSILEAIKNNKIKSKDVILIEALDRLGRLETLEMLSLTTSIINSGVAIITLEDQNEYSQETTRNNANLLYILLGKIQQAHDYSDRLSKRIKAAYRSKLTKARAGQKIRIITPLWLNTDGSLREKESSAVLACIDLYLRGHGTRSILLTLMDAHPCLRTVHPSTLKRWFKNRALIGEWQGTQPFNPLIDKSTFYKLQNELARRSKNMSPEQTYDLSGIVVCEKCGSRYYYRRKLHNGNTIIYGNCSTYLKRGKPYCENNKTMPYEVLLFAFNQTYSNHLWMAAVADAISNTAEKVEALKSERIEISASIKNITTNLERFPEQPEFVERLEHLNQKRESLNKKILDLESGMTETSESYSIIEFIEHLEKDSDQAMEIWGKRSTLLNDPTMLREALKRVDYKIKVDGAIIKEPNGSQFELIRRSQSHKRYIINCTYKNPNQELSPTTWAAISRTGHPVEGATEATLYTNLAESYLYD